MNAARELHAEIEIDAPVERVWEVVTDTRALAEASPELLAMTPLLPGGFRKGQQYVGWNRRKLAIWPTRNVVVDFEPHKRVAWDTKQSGARWIYELEPTATGTRLTQRRPVPGRSPLVGRVFATIALGGNDGHADELEAALESTLTRLKVIAES